MSIFTHSKYYLYYSEKTFYLTNSLKCHNFPYLICDNIIFLGIIPYHPLHLCSLDGNHPLINILRHYLLGILLHHIYLTKKILTCSSLTNLHVSYYLHLLCIFHPLKLSTFSFKPLSNSFLS